MWWPWTMKQTPRSEDDLFLLACLCGADKSLYCFCRDDGHCKPPVI